MPLGEGDVQLLRLQQAAEDAVLVRLVQAPRLRPVQVQRPIRPQPRRLGLGRRLLPGVRGALPIRQLPVTSLA